MSPRRRTLAALLALSLVAGCEAGPAFPVPAGPPKLVAVDVELPVYVLGGWTVGSFTDALRIELAKYRIEIVDPRSRPVVASVRIDLGEITVRRWQAIDVRFVVFGQEIEAGQVRVTDLGTATLEAAAEPVAAIIARRLWGVAT